MASRRIESAKSQMRLFSQETRDRMSLAAKKRCTEEWRRRKSEEYSMPVDVLAVRSLYESGLTQEETANALGLTRKVIERVMRQNKILARKAAKRDQWGDKNTNWRGDSATKSKLHRRLDRRFGKPKKCSTCGTTDGTRTYDWANLTGHYTDINDYKRMCRSCHWKFDKKFLNFNGRKGAPGHRGTRPLSAS